MKLEPNLCVGAVFVRETADGRVVLGGGIPLRLEIACRLVLSICDHNYAYSRAGEGRTYEALLAAERLYHGVLSAADRRRAFK